MLSTHPNPSLARSDFLCWVLGQQLLRQVPEASGDKV